MKCSAQRKCQHCKEFYLPDRRNLHHQRYCEEPACRRQRKAESQRRWVQKSESQNYSWVGADTIWSYTCPKTGVVTLVESPSSISSYIGLHQLLRSSISQKKMLHEMPRSCS